MTILLENQLRIRSEIVMANSIAWKETCALFPFLAPISFSSKNFCQKMIKACVKSLLEKNIIQSLFLFKCSPGSRRSKKRRRHISASISVSISDVLEQLSQCCIGIIIKAVTAGGKRVENRFSLVEKGPNWRNFMNILVTYDIQFSTLSLLFYLLSSL